MEPLHFAVSDARSMGVWHRLTGLQQRVQAGHLGRLWYALLLRSWNNPDGERESKGEIEIVPA